MQQVGELNTVQLSTAAGLIEVKRNYRNECPAGDHSKCEEHEAVTEFSPGQTSKPDQGRAQTGKLKKNVDIFAILILE